MTKVSVTSHTATGQRKAFGTFYDLNKQQRVNGKGGRERDETMYPAGVTPGTLSEA